MVETPTQIAEARAAKFVFESWMIYLVLATPAFNGTPIAFVAADDSTYDLRRIKQALRTEGFSGTGLVSFDVTCHRSGKVPSGARVAFQVRDAGTDQLLAEFASIQAITDTTVSVSLPLRYYGRQVRLALDFTTDEQCRAYELECWNILLDEGSSSPAAEAEHKASMATDLIPKDYALHANYPNPFNPSTRFDFDLPKGANVAFLVFDVLGRRVATRKEGFHEPGYHSVVWEARNVASGVY